MIVQLVRFQRFKNALWESGVAFGMTGANCYDVADILDESGKLVGAQLYDYCFAPTKSDACADVINTADIV